MIIVPSMKTIKIMTEVIFVASAMTVTEKVLGDRMSSDVGDLIVSYIKDINRSKK